MKPSETRQLLWMARNGTLDMLQARGIALPSSVTPIDEEEVERRLRENVPGLFDILLEPTEDRPETLYVWFAEPTGPRSRAVNLPMLREIVAEVQRRAGGGDAPLRIILVLLEDRTIRGLEDQMRKDDATFRGRVELFSQRDVIMPVASHVTQPKITILTPEQRESLRRDLHVDPAKDLARMRDHDKLARYLAIPKHSVVRIERPDGTVAYRLVE